jgi:hypothetical protein
MGCELGKLASSGGSGNNRKPDEAAPPATVDPRLPLTAKQKYNMLASWKGISRAMESTGVCMFLKYVAFIRKTSITNDQISANIKV